MMLRTRATLVILVGALGFVGIFLALHAGRLRAGSDGTPTVVMPPADVVVGSMPGWDGAAQAALPPVDPPVPVVALFMRVPAAVSPGQEIEYHICVENRSAALAHHVLVRDPLPANARFIRATPEPSLREPELQWQLGTLKPGALCDIRLVLAPVGLEDVPNCARVQFEHGQCVSTKVAHPTLRVEKTGPAEAFAGDTLNYEVTVTNTGTAPATGVILGDRLATGLEPAPGQSDLQWDLGQLAPGQTQFVHYQVLAKTPGRYCNRAVVSADGGLHESAEHCVVVGKARLGLTKTGPSRRYVRTPTAYEITVTNQSATPITEVAVADPLTAETELVSAGQGGQFADGQVRWAVGTLAPLESRTLELVVRAREAGRFCDRATATAAGGLSADAEACTEFVGVSALLLEVVDTDDPVEVGTETSYVILVRNQGTLRATNVRIEGLVPEQMSVTRVTGPSDNARDGQRVTFQPLTLAPGGQARYVIYVKALRPGDVRFKVDLNADPLTAGPVHEEESTTIYAPPASAAPEGRQPP
jgi:uncharacterized repeat protein (TIGR01451 family)